MSFALKPKSQAGARFADAARSLIAEFRERADNADRAGTMCSENFNALARTGIPGAFVPESLGGFGLRSVHDWLLGIATLARGDGSTAIAINMHLGVTRGMALAYEAGNADGRASDGLRTPLEAVANGTMLICATATERGTDNLHPQTTAVKTAEGWRIDGTKLFVTMSPIATHLAMILRMRDEEGDHLATTMLPIDAVGIFPQDDWDALGMRGSGSQSVRFDNVLVDRGGVRRIGPWGQWSTAVLINRTLGNLPLVAAFLGIAEHAYEVTMTALSKQTRGGDPINRSAGVQHTVGEMEIELAKCRSILQQAGIGADEWLQEAQESPPTLPDAHNLMKDYQSAKWVVNRGAIDIVSKAMDLVGGGGYMNSNVLARLYRDVRAGPFMQPHSPLELRAYVGQVALGLLPDG